MDKNTLIKELNLTKEEKENFEHFIEYHGIDQYLVAYDFLNSKIDTITYPILATTLRYDKRIRRIIYAYFGLIEEFFRAEVLRNNINLNEIKRVTPNMSNYDKICHATFNELIKMYKKISENIIKKYYTSYIKKDLDCLIALRNLISHNRFILDSNNLSAYIKTLYKYIPDDAKEAFYKEIIDACKEKESKFNYHSQQPNWILPEEIIVNSF